MLKWLLLAAIVLRISPASAQTLLDAPASGEIVSIGAAKLRLPAGQWKMVSESGSQPYVDGGGLSGTPMAQRLYVQTQGDRIAALLLVSSNVVPSSTGWAPPQMCGRTDTYWSGHRNGWTNNFDCALVNHAVMRERANMTGLMKAAYDTVRPLGGMPRQMVRADFAVASQRNELSVLLYLNTELVGFQPSDARWSNSEWTAGRLDPAHRSYLDKVVAWASAYRVAVRDAVP